MFLEHGSPRPVGQVDVVTVRCLSGPAMTDLRTGEVRVEGDDILVCAPDP